MVGATVPPSEDDFWQWDLTSIGVTEYPGFVEYGTVTATQVLDGLVPGCAYRVEFDYNYFSCSSSTFAASAGNALLEFNDTDSSAGKSFTFTAASSSTAVAFRGFCVPTDAPVIGHGFNNVLVMAA